MMDIDYYYYYNYYYNSPTGLTSAVIFINDIAGNKSF